MSQASLSIPNESGATARAGFNSALQAVDSMFAGATDPSMRSMSYAYMFWIDTGNNLVKQRNSANDTWEVRGHLDSNGCIVWDANMVALASASTMTIGGADAEIISVTGTTTITAFDSPSGNPHRTLIFGSALTVTYSSSAILLPGSASITVSAGDVMEFVYEGSGIWKCVNYFKNSTLADVGIWQKSETVSAGDIRYLSSRTYAGYYLKCTTAGTTGTTEPTPSKTVGLSITDNTAVWTLYVLTYPIAEKTGVIKQFAGDTAPDGYLLCDGSAVSRTIYADLFAVIGTKYGSGDGSTTFNVPSFIGKFAEGGSVSGAVHSAALPNIRGEINFPSGDYNTAIKADSGTSGALSTTQGTSMNFDYNRGQNAHNLTKIKFDASSSNSVYSDSATTVQPASVVVLYIIKT